MQPAPVVETIDKSDDLPAGLNPVAKRRWWTFSVVNFPKNDSAIALSKQIPVRPTEQPNPLTDRSR
jgi:hypothetical protein